MRGKKLTLKEIEDRAIDKAIKRIKTIEMDYSAQTTRSACRRYLNRELGQIKLEREIRTREEELLKLKGRKR